MAAYEGRLVENQTVILDGHVFSACEFQNCRMVYKGGDLPRLQHCRFTRCTWHLEDAAQKTILFLKNIYHSGPGGKDLVEETLKHIRLK